MNRTTLLSIIVFFSVFKLHCQGVTEARPDSAIKNEVILSSDTVLVGIEKFFEKNRVFKFGMSVGPKHVIFWPSSKTEDRLRWGDYSISPLDSTLQFNPNSRYSLVLSAVLVTFPFANNDRKFWRWLKPVGVIANVDLAQFGGMGNYNIFNQRIEGGLGISVKISERFVVSGTLEWLYNRSPKEFLMEKTGEKLIVNGSTLTSLDPSDNRYFIDDTYSAWSLKYVFLISK